MKSSCWTIFNDLSWVIPHNTHSSNPTITISASNLRIIFAATQLYVLLWCNSSATSTSAMTDSQIHLLPMNHIAETWRWKISNACRPQIEFLWQWNQSACNWKIGWAFNSLTTTSWFWRIYLWHIWSDAMLRTDLLTSGLWISSLLYTPSWHPIAPHCILFSSSIITFNYFKISCTDWLILW